ncbi:MAG: hypothetical protein RJA22_1735 [Verrucomicrobiota bacterium]
MAHILNRRSFLKTGAGGAFTLGLASLLNTPPFLRQALAEGSIGLNGKKLIFIFLRGGNDGVNNIIPVLDPSYYGQRAQIGIPKHPTGDAYYQGTGGPGTLLGVDPAAPGAAIPLNNGFAGINPALSDLVPLYNAGDLALVHRAGYRSLSRSHFDSERYWEKATDGTSANRLVGDGIWYRTIVESGWNLNHALSGVSIQSNLPQSLRGEQPMTNLSSIGRYNLLGVAGSSTANVNGTTVLSDRTKLLNRIDAAHFQPRPSKDNREMLYNLGVQFRDTLDIFQDPTFQSNNFPDDGLTGYPSTTQLFPINTASDQRGLGSGAYGFMQNIKTCAQILNRTDAIISGTEIGGWDTHTAQVTVGSPHLGGHATLLRRVAWAYYSLWKYFKIYGKNGSNPAPGATTSWDDVVVVAMSEFGRTSRENGSVGTDHAEASVMYVAGGGVQGGTFGCDILNSPILGGPNWVIGDGTTKGSLFSITNSSNVPISEGYIKRTIDYRSVLGEIIRDHLGATQSQLNRIIPAYANESVEHLLSGGMVATTPILGELGLV